jgi:hypothetical protein
VRNAGTPIHPNKTHAPSMGDPRIELCKSPSRSVWLSSRNFKLESETLLEPPCLCFDVLVVQFRTVLRIDGWHVRLEFVSGKKWSLRYRQAPGLLDLLRNPRGRGLLSPTTGNFLRNNER